MQGFTEYRETVKDGKLTPGQVIEIDDLSRPKIGYRVIDENTLDPIDLPGHCIKQTKAKKLLRGNTWYIKE